MDVCKGLVPARARQRQKLKMNKPDWQTVKDLFAEVLDEPAESRLAVLAARCQGDEPLFREVSTLLAAADESNNLIENNAIDLAARVGGDGDYTERHFGNYRIIREIGSGGMGTVFLAARVDGEFSMQVALKIVRQSVADRDIITRFKRERQILAGLNHPNIAVLHDGGVSDKDEPYLAMEFVEGETLMEYCESRDLSMREKLELFLKICSAVSYAHKNLVVHRDIKPSNIIVTAEGEPKLLDFGLAKAFEADASATQTLLRAFTPAYASPEQIRGQNITTASDIYSLGVVFYEMLTGVKPLDLDNKSYDEILHTLNNIEPEKPSSLERTARHTSSAQLLEGDLDNIALTALRKEPERRFSTVDDLADDIRRHLDGRPITARPNTPGYLAGKFIRRNRLTVAAAGLIVVSLVTGLALSLWQADRARRERDRAEKRFGDVRQLANSLLFEISPKLEKLPGSIEAREALVEKALSYLDSLAAETHTDTELNAELASAYEKVGDLQGNIEKPNLSDFAAALSSFDKARTIRHSLPESPENWHRIANSLKVTSSIRNRQHDVAGALNDAAEARQIFRERLLGANTSTEVTLDSIEADIQEAQIYSFNNRYAEAIPRFRTAAASLAALDQSTLRTRRLSAVVYAALGNALSWDGQQAEAETEMAIALSISEKLEREAPTDSEVLSTALQTYILASSIANDADPTRALVMAHKAVASAKRAVDADRADAQATYNLARAYSRAGISQANVDDLSDAAASLRLAESILTGLIEREPRNLIYQRDLGKVYVRMGDAGEKRNDIPDALLKYQNSAVIFEKISISDPANTLARRDLAQSLKSVAKSQIALAQPASAKANLQKAKNILEQLKAAGALGGYDQQLIDDVERTLAELS